MEKLLGAADLQQDDVVLEVGPGLGAVTQQLLSLVSRVIAVEKDMKMVQLLRQSFQTAPNLEVLHEDALEVSIPQEPYKVVANLPYYITAPLIRRFLEAEHQPTLMALLMQKEVAERIVAKPPHMSLLALGTQLYATPRLVAGVKRGVFWPMPRVDAGILRIDQIHKMTEVAPVNLFRVARAAFSSPRKQLTGTLRSQLKLSRIQTEHMLTQARIDPRRRPGTLEVVEWIALTKAFILNT